MPVKRRIEKSRKIDAMKIKELHYGPGTCLLAGCGYYVPGSQKFYFDHSEQEQDEIVEWMREDWTRHHRQVMASWEARDEHDLYIASHHHGDPAEPWALTEFGQP